jgi:hypothetical protein
MAAIEPTLKSVLSLLGQADTPEGKAAILAFDAALVAVREWKNGTPAENVIQAMTDFQNAFNAVVEPLGLDPKIQLLVNVVLAGVETVIGILLANSPAPQAPAGLKAHSETQAMHQSAVIAHTTLRVKTLVPSFKRSIWHSPESQYKSTWNHAVAEGEFPDTLKTS